MDDECHYEEVGEVASRLDDLDETLASQFRSGEKGVQVADEVRLVGRADEGRDRADDDGLILLGFHDSDI